MSFPALTCQDITITADCTSQSLLDFPRELRLQFVVRMKKSPTLTLSTFTSKDNVNSQVTRHPHSCPPIGTRTPHRAVSVHHTRRFPFMSTPLASMQMKVIIHSSSYSLP
jgi:hypothetical protein